MACLDASLPSASCQAVSNVLWAAARLQLQHLPGSWLDSLLSRAYSLMPAASGQELGVLVQALQQLGHRPTSKWLAR